MQSVAVQSVQKRPWSSYGVIDEFLEYGVRCITRLTLLTLLRGKDRSGYHMPKEERLQSGEV